MGIGYSKRSGILRSKLRVIKKYAVSKFINGWFFECALKSYKKGDRRNAHFHKKADEFTVVVNGSCRFNKKVFTEGDIVWVEKNETIVFEALTDSKRVVIKIPSVKGDKYEI